MMGDRRSRNRLCLVGPYGAGKTSLARRFVGLPFDPALRFTIACSTSVCPFPTRENPRLADVKVHLDDTSGEERYRNSLTSTFVRYAQCVLVCFDLSSEKSYLAAINEWLPWSQEESSSARHILVGMKSDIKVKAVPRQTVLRWAKDCGLQYFETSAKTGHGVSDLLASIGSYFRYDQEHARSIAFLESSIHLEMEDHDRQHRHKISCPCEC